MNILYTPKIVKLDKNKAQMTYELRPINDNSVTMMRRTTVLSEQFIEQLETLNTESEILQALRKLILRGNSGYQADWAAEKALKAFDPISLINTLDGYVFDPTTEDELAVDSYTPPEPDTNTEVKL